MTEFERLVINLGLANEGEMIVSMQLKDWVYKNATHRYVPEWLLKQWGITVDDIDVR